MLSDKEIRLERKISDNLYDSDYSDDLMNENDMKLPDNFADQVMDLEIEITKNDVSIDTVNQLMSLYSQAIDYYCSIQDNKYLYFKKKLQLIMQAPQCISAMDKAVLEKSLANEDQEESRIYINAVAEIENKYVEIKQKKKDFEISCNTQASHNDTVQKSLVISHAKNCSKKDDIVKTNLDNQADKFQSRLNEIRSRKNLNAIDKADFEKICMSIHSEPQSKKKTIQNNTTLKFNKTLLDITQDLTEVLDSNKTTIASQNERENRFLTDSILDISCIVRPNSR